MNEFSAYKVQMRIACEERISVPWVQSVYELNYKTARWLINVLVMRGCISGACDGVYHKVYKNKMLLRYLKKDEVEGIVDILADPAVVRILRAACCAEGIRCNKIKTLALSTNTDESAIKALIEHELLYMCRDRYFSRISLQTVEVMTRATEVLRKMKIMDYGKKNKKTDYSQVYEVFDELFE